MPIIRKWGDSLAITIPSDEAKKRNLNEGDEVFIQIYKKLDAKLFGTLPKKYANRVSGQHAKDSLREEW